MRLISRNSFVEKYDVGGRKELPMPQDVSSCLEGTILTNGLVRMILPKEKYCISEVAEKRDCTRETFRQKNICYRSF
jgi:hypothetical protein